MKGKLLNDVIEFYNKMKRLVDDRRAVDAIYINFTKILIAISHDTVTYKLMKNDLDMCILK